TLRDALNCRQRRCPVGDAPRASPAPSPRADTDGRSTHLERVRDLAGASALAGLLAAAALLWR
ncbi:MAG: hypothetical protein HY554_07635, partial [Elusimicrobia bacterium]|nr:hypothetical protein [Elusimicrobiota bacterium]